MTDEETAPLPPPRTTPRRGERMCMIAFTMIGTDLEQTVQRLRFFRDNIILRSKYRNVFKKILKIYYLFSPVIVKKMQQNNAYKLSIRNFVVKPIIKIMEICIINLYITSA